ncbi:MAG: hypothetical protein QOD42_2576 [Sphingomonadales bacterium]|jgi:hypothetical protein|nr:hypothetical protein [Sphingomonadales bacterium]
MYGTVLGFGDGRGVIVTQDERRFAFTLENWREPQPPVRGAAVNFVARDGIADDIYLALSAMPPAAPAPAPGPAAAGPGPSGSAMPGDTLRALVAQVKGFPQLALAAAILFAFLLMPYASFGSGMGGRNDTRFEQRDTRRMLSEDRRMGRFGLADRDDASMAGLNGALSPLRDLATVASDENEERLGRISVTAESEGRAELRRQAAALGRLGFILALAYFVWLIPLGAIGLIALHRTGRHRLAGATSLALGVLCVLSGFYLNMLENAGMEVFPRDVRGEIRLAFSRAFDLGAGGWLIALCGLGLIVLFFVRRGSAAAV